MSNEPTFAGTGTTEPSYDAESPLSASGHVHAPEGKEVNSLIVGLIVLAVLTLTTTFVVGANWGRWGNFAKRMQEAGKSLQRIPREFGEWEASGEDEKLSQAATDQLELSDYVIRRYKNKHTDENVALIMMVGPSGRLAIHTPQVCFGGRNYREEMGPIPIVFPYQTKDGLDEKDTFSKIVFKNLSINGGAKIFYYAMSAGGPWLAVKSSARADFQKYRFMYKIQLEAFVSEDATKNDDCVERFLRDFLPEIRGTLVDCS